MNQEQDKKLSPRVRNLLRQAEKVAASGKRSAAEQLYRQIIDEFPEVSEAWAGLGHVLINETEKREAFEKALSLDEEDQSARRGLLELDGEADSQESVAVKTSDESSPTPDLILNAAVTEAPGPDQLASQIADDHIDYHQPFYDESDVLVCYRHPDRDTSLRCNRCNRPICVECANRTSVGYRCPECLREIEADYYTAKPSDYILATVVAAPLSLVAGYRVTLVGGSFFFILIIAMVGGAIGSFIARITHRAIGRRRGRYTPQLVAGIVAAGGVLPVLFRVVIFLALGAGFGLFALIIPAIYALVAASAAYYQLR